MKIVKISLDYWAYFYCMLENSIPKYALKSLVMFAVVNDGMFCGILLMTMVDLCNSARTQQSTTIFCIF